MTSYALRSTKYDWREMEPVTNSSMSEEYVSEHYDLYITSEVLYNKDTQKYYRRYRLHANRPHSIEMALAYDIKCPHCGTNNLKQIGRCQDHFTLGLYECPVCDR